MKVKRALRILCKVLFLVPFETFSHTLTLVLGRSRKVREKKRERYLKRKTHPLPRSPKVVKGNIMSFHTIKLGAKWRKHPNSNDERA